MSETIVTMVIEMFVSILVEGVILSLIFGFISNQASEKSNKHLKEEMNNIETQNKFIYEQLHKELGQAKTEIISQIKEANYTQKGGDSK